MSKLHRFLHLMICKVSIVPGPWSCILYHDRFFKDVDLCRARIVHFESWSYIFGHDYFSLMIVGFTIWLMIEKLESRSYSDDLDRELVFDELSFLSFFVLNHRFRLTIIGRTTVFVMIQYFWLRSYLSDQDRIIWHMIFFFELFWYIFWQWLYHLNHDRTFATVRSRSWAGDRFSMTQHFRV